MEKENKQPQETKKSAKDIMAEVNGVEKQTTISKSLEDLNKVKIIETSLSIRRKPIFHLPNDDPKRATVKIGSSLAPNSRYPLRGLSFEEEKLFLPELTGISPKDVAWRTTTSNYWSDISVAVPDDGEGIVNGYAGKILKFIVEIKGAKNIEKYNEASLEGKANLLSKWVFPNDNGEVIATLLEGIEDYVLFRYCLVYSRVANNVADVNKSPKIQFYLYSKDEENKAKKANFDIFLKSTKEFISIIEDSSKVDAMLRLYGKNPVNFNTDADKQLFLKEEKDKNPKQFVDFAIDKNLLTKALIKEAVQYGIIKNPINTETYYYGDNNEVLLGKSMNDVILYFASKEELKASITARILSQIKSKKI